MKCAIMQPTYMPWAGYFNLIGQVDIFVFLDDVQYEKRSWQSRNRILIQGQAHWISVPVRYAGRSQTINLKQVDDEQKWRDKHYKMLSFAYAKHPYAGEMLDITRVILDPAMSCLADINIKLIQEFASHLGLPAKFIRASQLSAGGKRSEHLMRICQILGCDEYLSPRGSAEYLEEDGVFSNSPVRLLFQEYIPSPYPQLGTESFISHLSIIDVLANLGWKRTFQYVQSGAI